MKVDSMLSVVGAAAPKLLTAPVDGNPDEFAVALRLADVRDLAPRVRLNSLTEQRPASGSHGAKTRTAELDADCNAESVCSVILEATAGGDYELSGSEMQPNAWGIGTPPFDMLYARRLCDERVLGSHGGALPPEVGAVPLGMTTQVPLLRNVGASADDSANRGSSGSGGSVVAADVDRVDLSQGDQSRSVIRAHFSPTLSGSSSVQGAVLSRIEGRTFLPEAGNGSAFPSAIRGRTICGPGILAVAHVIAEAGAASPETQFVVSDRPGGGGGFRDGSPEEQSGRVSAYRSEIMQLSTTNVDDGTPNIADQLAGFIIGSVSNSRSTAGVSEQQPSDLPQRKVVHHEFDAPGAAVLKLLKVTLHPDSLGQIDIHLYVRNNELRVQLRSGNVKAREVLATQRDALSGLLNAEGFACQSVVVDVLTGRASDFGAHHNTSPMSPGTSFEHSSNGGRGGSQDRKSSNRDTNPQRTVVKGSDARVGDGVAGAPGLFV